MPKFNTDKPNRKIHEVNREFNKVNNNSNQRDINKLETKATKTCFKIFEKKVKIFSGEAIKRIAMGSNKKVYVSVNPIEGAPGKKPTVLYTAVKTFFQDFTKTLKDEMALCRFLSSKIDKEGEERGVPKGGKECLAIEYEELNETIKGKAVFQVEKAECDGEDFVIGDVKDHSVTYQERFSIIEDILKGFATLNKMGYAYGDGKPENLLVYKDTDTQKYRAKIADFGKTQKIIFDDQGNEIPGQYSGNFRFCPPEGTLSTKADSWSTALIIIRLLEDPLLDEGKPLVSIKSQNRDIKAIKKRRGVEKYVTEHKAFLGLDNNNIFGKIVRQFRGLRLKKLSEKQQKKQQNLIHDYIAFLCDSLESKDLLDKNQSKQLSKLLFQMTEFKPETRIDTKTALEIYQEIGLLQR